MKKTTVTSLGPTALLLAFGCSDDSNPGNANDNTGGTAPMETGGTTSMGAGGAMATGTGGTTSMGTGGSMVTATGGTMPGTGGTQPGQLDRSAFTNVGTDGPLDYSVPQMWACRPDIAQDECNNDLDATEIQPDGTRVAVPHQRAAEPKFDCFYAYPTVLLNGDPQMVDFSQAGIDMVNDPLQTQGARFSSMCRMFVPMYRQVGLSGGAPVAGSDPALGAQDVRDAFAYYMENWNEGRKFVLIAHSQGTRMLSLLVQQDIDPADRASVREQMLSALLIGGAIVVPEGQAVGGTFENVPICTTAGETGCVIAYASYAADSPPGDGDLFGRAPAEGQRVSCVNPAVIAGNEGAYTESYFRASISNPTFAPDNPLPEDLETPFAMFRNLFRGECVENGEFNYLEITLQPEGDADMRVPPWRNTAVEGLGFGLHLVDYHIPLGDLLAAVAAQARAAGL